MLKMWGRIGWCWVLLHLTVLSAEDLYSGFVSVCLIGTLGVSGTVSALLAGRTINALPGLGLLAIGYLSGERIGYGDGFLVLSLGTWMSMPELLGMVGTGILYAAGAAFLMRRKEMPLIPFLTAAYVLRGWN